MSSHKNPNKVPFPGGGSSGVGGGGDAAPPRSPGMSIEIPKGKSGGVSSYEEPARSKEQHQHHSHPQQQQQHYHSVGQAAGRSFHHHPRQPGPNSEGYFSGSLSSSAGGAPRTPGSLRGGHSRNVSTASAVSNVPKSQSMMATTSVPGHSTTATAPAPVAQSSYDWMPPHPQSAWAGMGHGGGMSAAGGGLPSPSTLTDILLGLHSTLYGAKKSPEEVKEMVGRYYDADAIFESPLLAAKGREQIANQFIMAFALPGLDVTSELRDVICSDFEFDGTRAGIIDQTISVTILPSVFGRNTPTFRGPGTSAPGGVGSNVGGNGGAGGPSGYPSGTTPFPRTSGYPSHGGHSAVTPHPFADYRTPGASAFNHHPSGATTQGHSPTTPFSLSSLWGGGGSSRPHTPGGFFSSGGAGSSGIRPFTSSNAGQVHHRTSTPPSVNGGYDDDDDDDNIHGPVTAYATAEAVGGGQVSQTSRLRMPLGAITPHWGSEGLGRSTVASFLWSLFHPRAVLKSLCTIHLRLMSRLEFNDAGQIVRHEDTWGVRETIEGTIPFASLIYALERRVVGYIASWAVDKGFSLSSALHPRAIAGAVHESDVALLDRKDAGGGGVAATDAAHALLGRGRGHFTGGGSNSGAFMPPHDMYQTISRSRAPSPSRLSGWVSGSVSATPYVTGTRSRARSSAGSLYGGSRATSTDNLVGLGASASGPSGGGGGGPSGGGAGGGSSAYFASRDSMSFDRDLPPDSSARYRTSLNKRIEGGRANSAASAPPHEMAGSSSSATTTTDEDYAAVAMRARAPDRDDR